MKRMIFFVWLLMLSMVATAQTFVVVDKKGNRVSYDVSRWIAPNNMIEFNADDLTEAKFLIKNNGDGTMSASAHLKSTDGHEGWFKLKATRSPWD